MRKKQEPDSFAETYPTIAKWVLGGGWIEIGHADHTRSFVRALDDGGMVFEGELSYPTLDGALEKLEAGIKAWLVDKG